MIPTAGIAVDGVQYLHFMSVRSWGEPGRWRTNYSRIAHSTDGGQTWRTDGPRWNNQVPRWWWPRRGEAGFQLGAFVRDGEQVLRSAPAPTGPWSTPQPVVRGTRLPRSLRRPPAAVQR